MNMTRRSLRHRSHPRSLTSSGGFPRLRSLLAAAGLLLIVTSPPVGLATTPVGSATADATGGTPLDSSGAAEAWRMLERMQPPAEPADWATRSPTDEARREHYQKQVEFACQATDLASEFYRRFPDHDQAPAAMTLESRWMAPFQEAVLEHRAVRFEAEAAREHAGDELAIWTEIERKARAMQDAFPESYAPSQWLLRIARRAETGHARKLAAEVRDRKGLADFVREEAVALLKRLDMVGKPLAMQFTALDGREVDLGQMKGKVVLVDFWASWCVPCVAELPQILATYDKLHAEGLEVVGVSFDEHRENLVRFLAAKRVPWPQFFDGQGWSNRVGRELGIQTLPTLWLVDRQGLLRDLNARSALEDKVRRLLAEPSDSSPAPNGG